MSNVTEENIEFTTIREDFSEYEIDNGQILKVKQVVTSIVSRADAQGKKGGSINFKTLSNVVTPSPIDTSNLELVENPDHVTEKDVVGELKFRPLREITNIYETKNTLILLVPHLSKVLLTNKKDRNNAPHLRFTAIADVNILEKNPKIQTPNF